MDRCLAHGLATGPDGLCVLCRRERPPRSASPAWAFGIAGVVLASVVVAGLVRTTMVRREAARRDALPAVGGAPSVEAMRAASPDPAPTNAPAWPTLDRRAPPRATPTTTPPPTPIEATAQAGATRPAPSDADLASARRDVVVTMYTTSWCPRCKEAKAWMAAHGVAYAERDIEASDANMTECKRYNPKASIPTTLVDDAVLIGFGDAYFEHAIDQAARVRWARAH